MIAYEWKEDYRTTNPLCQGFTTVDLSFQFIHHSMEAVDDIYSVADFFETFTYSLIDCHSRECELQTTSVNLSRVMRPEETVDTHVSSSDQGFLPLDSRQCRSCPLS